MARIKNDYKILNRQIFEDGEYSLIPIRHEDRYEIMKWRNEQLYHLRQKNPLTKQVQDTYFNEVISRLFKQIEPEQILFSFLKNSTCIGYGGLVHIDWTSSHAEISFIMNTSLEKNHFQTIWLKFLSLIEIVAFDELNLNKIYTHAYEIRTNLFPILQKAKFQQEARLKKHIKFEDKFIDALIHYKLNPNLHLRKITIEDVEITYNWFINEEIRKFSFNQRKVSFKEHCEWIHDKLHNENCLYFLVHQSNSPIGSIRGDLTSEGVIISFLVDPKYHGQGFGKWILAEGVKAFQAKWAKTKIIGYVKNDNIASLKIFKSLGFLEKTYSSNTKKYIKK